MTAALRLAPQYAVKSISSSPHCTVHFVTSHGERTTLMPTAGPDGPGSLFRAGRAGRPWIALRPLTLTATHHCPGQYNRSNGPQDTHGDADAMARSARTPLRADRSPVR